MTRFLLAKDAANAAALLAKNRGAELLAGGTDVVARLREGIAPPEALVRVGRALPRDVAVDAGALSLGAAATLADVVASEHARALPALVEACDHTATPQIRNAATVGGALRQKVRCPYFRHPDRRCLRKGGAQCLARDGDHGTHAIFENDTSCIAVHPSTLLCALLALDGEVAYATADHPEARARVDDLVRIDVYDPIDDLALPQHAVLTRVRVPLVEARQGYLRASSRELADWALVEAAARVRVEGGVVVDARIALGAVARAPRRAHDAERALVGKPFTSAAVVAAAKRAAAGATPLAHNAYKVKLVEGAVEALLARLV